MSVSNCMFTSNTDEWSTPQYLFDALNAEFNFDVDVCASRENAKCKKIFYKGTKLFIVGMARNMLYESSVW